jgi:hypothetical protein
VAEELVLGPALFVGGEAGVGVFVPEPCGAGEGEICEDEAQAPDARSRAIATIRNVRTR